MQNNDIYGFSDTISMESFDNMGGFEPLEAASTLNDLVTTANQIQGIRDSILSDGVSKTDALALESLNPGFFPQYVPMHSFTQMRSHTNLTVTLESIKSWTTMSIANMVKALYRFLMSCVNWVKNAIKGFFGTGKDAKRVISNTEATVKATNEIVTQTRGATDSKTDEAFHKAKEKAKLLISDHYTQLMRRMVSDRGTENMVRHLRGQLHTAYAKLDVLTEKYVHALDISSKGEINYQEANSIFADLASFNPGSLLDLDLELSYFDLKQKLSHVNGSVLVQSLWDSLKQQNMKRASWEVKTSDVISGMLQLTTRLEELADDIIDPELDTTVPTVVDFSSKVRNAPEGITPNLALASQRLTEGFTVAQHGIGIYVELLKAFITLTDLGWKASKSMMGDIATKAKTDCTEYAAVIKDIEQRLKTTLQKQS